MTRLLTMRSLFFTFVVLALFYFLFQSTSSTFDPNELESTLRQQAGVTQNFVPQDEHVWTPETDLTLEAPHKLANTPKEEPPSPSPIAKSEEVQHPNPTVIVGQPGKPPPTVNSPSSASLPNHPQPHTTIPAEDDSHHPAFDPVLISTSTSSISSSDPPVYTRALVIARTKKEIEETEAWTSENTRIDPNLRVVPYTVDDRTAQYRVPLNKGHESMVFLTYIIDHYDENFQPLPDVSIFMHASKITWHNNDLLDSSSVNIVKHLSTPKVLRDGYFNLRCHLDPGCPAHLHPSANITDPHQPEETQIRNVWPIIFPGEPVPDVLSQPCCSQFALSRDRILTIPKSRYEAIRTWLMTTHLPDVITGRIMEYVWQKLWTGQDEYCPVEHVCYCDAYGMCFGDKTNFDLWFERRKEFRALAPKLNAYVKKQEAEPEKEWLKDPMAVALRKSMEGLRELLGITRDAAVRRGRDPRIRAEEAGRVWKEGDGF